MKFYRQILIACVVACVLSLLIPALALTAAHAELYPSTLIVFEVDDGIARASDFNGEVWELDAEDWDAGDMVSVLMDDMETESIDDDEIVEYKYSGWVIGCWGWSE